MRKYLNNWDAVRIIRLLAGVGFGIYAVVSKEYLFLMLAGMFLLQSIFTVSCSGAGGCSTEPKKTKTQVYKDQIEQYKG